MRALPWWYPERERRYIREQPPGQSLFLLREAEMAKELVSVEADCLKLKKQINENHRLAQAAAADAVERGVLTGELLLQWKDLLPHGRFESFTETHFDGSLRTARAYMQVAKRLNALPKRQRSAVLKQERSISGLISEAKTEPAIGPRQGAQTQHEAGDTQEDLGACPNCRKTDWEEDEDGWSCAKCHHPHGEPAGDVDKDRVATQRQKTVKTAEALLRAFDDLNEMLPKAEHAEAIQLCKSALRLAKGWK